MTSPLSGKRRIYFPGSPHSPVTRRKRPFFHFFRGPSMRTIQKRYLRSLTPVASPEIDLRRIKMSFSAKKKPSDSKLTVFTPVLDAITPGCSISINLSSFFRLSTTDDLVVTAKSRDSWISQLRWFLYKIADLDCEVFFLCQVHSIVEEELIRQQLMTITSIDMHSVLFVTSHSSLIQAVLSLGSLIYIGNEVEFKSKKYTTDGDVVQSAYIPANLSVKGVSVGTSVSAASQVGDIEEETKKHSPKLSILQKSCSSMPVNGLFEGECRVFKIFDVCERIVLEEVWACE